MLITLEKKIDKKEMEELNLFFENKLMKLNKVSDDTYLIVGDTHLLDQQTILALPGVIKCIRINHPYKLASRDYKQDNTIVKVGSASFGDGNIYFICGPCSVESNSQIENIASTIKDAGANVLRGGCFKPRTSPYFFQGFGEEALECLVKAKLDSGLPIVTEVVDTKILTNPLINDLDMIQIGARNMQNYELLKEVAKLNKPVLLKRSPSATIEELLLSAEYILKEGNPNVILCERGIRTFEKSSRYTLDLSSVAVLKKITHLPVIVDPSHAVGDYNFVSQMTLAAIASGADGVMIEVHDNPSQSLSDGFQALKANKLSELIKKGQEIKKIIK